MVRNVTTFWNFFSFLFYCYSQTLDNLEFIVVKVISGKRDILPRFWTFTTVYMTSALAHAPNCLALTGLALLGELSVYIKKAGQARRVILPSKKGDPARRVTLLAEPTFCFSRSLHLVSHVNGSQSFLRKCMKSWLPPGVARVRRWPLCPGKDFSL